MASPNLLSLFSEDKAVVVYRPRMAIALGNALAAALLNQICYWWERRTMQNAFYKFQQPCKHRLYQEGQSWTEELGISKHVLATLLATIGTKVSRTSGRSIEDVLNDVAPIWNEDDHTLRNASSLVVYWTDASHTTWFQLNETLLNAVLADIYLFRFSGTVYSRKPEQSIPDSGNSPVPENRNRLNPESGFSCSRIPEQTVPESGFGYKEAETTYTTTETTESAPHSGRPSAGGEGSAKQGPASQRLAIAFVDAWQSRYDRPPKLDFGKLVGQLKWILERQGIAESEILDLVRWYVDLDDPYVSENSHAFTILMGQWDRFYKQFKARKTSVRSVRYTNRSLTTAERTPHVNANATDDDRRPASGMASVTPALRNGRVRHPGREANPASVRREPTAAEIIDQRAEEQRRIAAERSAVPAANGGPWLDEADDDALPDLPGDL